MFGGGKFKRKFAEVNEVGEVVRNLEAAALYWRMLDEDKQIEYVRYWYGDFQFFYVIRNLLDYGTLDEVVLSDDTIIGYKSWFKLKYQAMNKKY